MFALTLEERDRRWKIIREAMKKQNLECLIVWGSLSSNPNITYLSSLLHQGYIVFPLEGDPTFLSFIGGPHYYNPWIADNRTGHPKYGKVISERLRELHLEKARIGIVQPSATSAEMGFPYVTYLSLTENFPKAKFEDATHILEEARMIKSPAEIRCIELACEAGEKAIQAIIDTAKPGVRDYEVKAKMMDTLFRAGCEPGSLILYYSGKDIIHGGQGGMICRYTERKLEKGDIIHTEFSATYLGYSAQFNQPFSIGEPDEDWKKIFSIAEEAFNNGFNTLKPGITAGELNEALLSPVRKAGYVARTPPFHGMGLTLEEPVGSFPAQPDYKPNLDRVIEPGMVIELEPPVVRPDFKRGTTLGCPVLVTETGCRLLSKNWKPEVKII